MTPSRVPVENIDLAYALMQHESTPAVVAAVDQIHAFHDEIQGVMQQAADVAGANYEEVKTTPLNVAWALAVTAAMPARTRRVCIHFAEAPPVPGQAAWIDLTLGLVACKDCYGSAAPALMALLGEVPDDGHCDVCDCEAEIFYAFNAPVGMWVVGGNQCGDCNVAMMGGPHGDE